MIGAFSPHFSARKVSKKSEGLNPHNRPQAERSRRPAYHIEQRSGRANLAKCSLPDCILECVNTTDCASLIRGYENIVFQAIILYTKNAEGVTYSNFCVIRSGFAPRIALFPWVYTHGCVISPRRGSNWYAGAKNVIADTRNLNKIRNKIYKKLNCNNLPLIIHTLIPFTLPLITYHLCLMPCAFCLIINH